MDDERPDEQRRRDVSGDAQGKKRNEVRAHDSAVGGLGARDALDVPLAEALGVPGGAACGGVAEEGREGRPEAGQRADRGADDCRTSDDRRDAVKVAPAQPIVRRAANRKRRGVPRSAPAQAVLELDQDLREREYSDADRHQRNAALELHHAEREARHRHRRIGANCRHQDAKGHCDQSLGR